MNTLTRDLFRYIFSSIPRALKYRSVCKDWNNKLREKVFIMLWEKNWLKAGYHLSWIDFTEHRIKKGWFGNKIDIGIVPVKLQYSGFHFTSNICNYYEFGKIKHTFRFEYNGDIVIGKARFYMNYTEKDLWDGMTPYMHQDGFHITKNQTLQFTQNAKNKIKKCSRQQHNNFIRIYNSGTFQHLIRAYIYFKSRK